MSEQRPWEVGKTGSGPATMAGDTPAGTMAGHTPEIGGTPPGVQTEDAGGALERAKTVARSVGEQARSMANNTGATAQDMARRMREQTGPAAESVYQGGARAGEYVTQNINRYPFAALLIAGAVGYGLAYLLHSGGQGE